MTLTGSTRRHLRTALANAAAAREIEQALDLASLGFTGNIFYVGASVDAASDSVTSGRSPESPFKTIDYAIGQTVSDRGDIIVVLPGHVERLGNNQTIDADVNGIVIVGLGTGSRRPKIVYDHATASFDIGANNVTLANLTFQPSVATVAIGVDVEAGKTGTRLLGLEFLPGEDGAGADEFVVGVDIKAGCTRTEIDGLKYAHHASVDGAAHAVRLNGASDLVTIRNFEIFISGTAAVAGIGGITAASTRLLIEKGVIVSDNEPGIELYTTTSGAIRDVDIFSDLATVDAATVASGMAHFRVQYVEVGNESGATVKTASADD